MEASFYRFTPWEPTDEASAYPAGAPGGGYPHEVPDRYVISGRGSLTHERNPANPAGDPLPAAFDPPRCGVWDTFGLDTVGEPGTRPETVPIPTVPYSPNIRETRPSYATQIVRATFSIALNRGLNLARTGWHAAPVPAVLPGRLADDTAGPRRQRMRPQGVFGRRVTFWPKAKPEWEVFGQ